MDCSHEKCGNRSIMDDRYLSCIMCRKVAHVKCIGVSGLVVDAALKNVGVRWFCHECDTVVIDFLRVRSTALQNLSSIEMELEKVQKRVSESSKALKSFVVPKTSSGKPKKRPNNIVIHSTNHSQTPSIPIIKTPEIIPLLDSPDAVISEPASSETAVGTSQKRSIFDISMSEDVPSPKPLVALSPKTKRRVVFVSRLAAKNTETDVLHYIKSRTKTEDGIFVKKFDFSYPRLIASFKITIPEVLFEKIVSEKFWPLNTLVREFEFKPNSAHPKVAELPKAKMNTASGVSKN